MGKQTFRLLEKKESPGSGGCTGFSSAVSPCPSPCLSFPQVHRAGAQRRRWTRGSVRSGVTWGTAAADALPFKGKLGSCLAGSFLACVWRWVIWLQSALIAGSVQKRKRKAEKLLRSEDCKGYTSARAGTAGAFWWEGGCTELQMGMEAVGSYPAPTLSLPRSDLGPAASCLQARCWAGSAKELCLSPMEMPSYGAGCCARA